jgi:hypothetical protein
MREVASKTLCFACFVMVSWLTLRPLRRIQHVTPIDFLLYTQRYIPEDSILHNHCCEIPIS